MRRRMVPGPDGANHPAVELGYRVSGEHWNEYLVDDGSVVRLKPVVTQILRIEDMHDPSGDPIYLVQSTNVMSTSVPEELRRGDAE